MVNKLQSRPSVHHRLNPMNWNPETKRVTFYRLKRLIARRKFDEGLNFARNFNLDGQLVHTARATHLTQQLSVWSTAITEELLDAKYEEWQATLDCITDIRFIVECCLKFAPSRVEFIRNSLAYARKRLDLYKTSDQVSVHLFHYHI